MLKSPNKRTIFLALLATVTFVWAAIYRFDVAPAELGRLLLYCFMGVFGTMLLAAITVGSVILLKKLWRRLRGGGDAASWPRE